MDAQTQAYTHKDFASDQENRWCPGCGDKAILNSLQKALPLLNKRKKTMFSFQELDALLVSLII